MSLTGKTRFRVKTGWFGTHKLVLQVEMKKFAEENKWRDATVEDLAELSNWKFNVVQST